MNDAKKMMLQKHVMLADQFKTHETQRRVSCSYTMGGRHRKKTPAQVAYERRMNDLLYKDRFDRIQAADQTEPCPNSTLAKEWKSKANRRLNKMRKNVSSDQLVEKDGAEDGRLQGKRDSLGLQYRGSETSMNHTQLSYNNVNSVA